MTVLLLKVLLLLSLLLHLITISFSLLNPSSLSLVSVCLSNAECSFRWSVRNMDYWPVNFWILTDSYLILYHFILTHLPASHVAGAIDPLWLNQRNHWSSAMQPLPLCFAYRIHKQTHKDVIEVRESSQSELTRWHARTQTHVGVASCNIWDSSNVLLKKVSRQQHQ